jgi:hypothetical protein
MHIWTPFSWTQRILSVYVWEQSGTLVKEQVSHDVASDCGAQWAHLKALVHLDQECPNQIIIYIYIYLCTSPGSPLTKTSEKLFISKLILKAPDNAVLQSGLQDCRTSYIKNRQVLFYNRVTFLKKVMQPEHKIPIKTVYFPGG